MQPRLTACPACAKFISIDALTCVKCGKRFVEGELAAKAAAIDADWQKSKGGYLWAIIILIALFLACGLLSRP